MARRIVALLKQAVANDDGDGQAALPHRLQVKPPDREPPITCTVYLQPDTQGTFLVTCKELPDIRTFGETEEALRMVELAILGTHNLRRGTPGVSE
jgi:hypothetical protein